MAAPAANWFAHPDNFAFQADWQQQQFRRHHQAGLPQPQCNFHYPALPAQPVFHPMTMDLIHPLQAFAFRPPFGHAHPCSAAGLQRPLDSPMTRIQLEDALDDGGSSSSEGDAQLDGPRRRRRRRGKRKRTKPRPLKKKPLPPAEETLEERPLSGGGGQGPIARHVGGWTCVLHDDHRRSFVSYRKQAFSAATLDRWRQALLQRIGWRKPERPPKEGKDVNDMLLPRSAAWLTLPGCRCEYEYAGLRFPAVAMPDWFLEITDQVAGACGLQDRPNSCNANLYRTGAENVSWHCDDEPLFDATGQDTLIVSLSLGATRSFCLRPKDDPFEETVLLLEDGDLCSMEGLCQKHYRHRVPPEEEVMDFRINLTWRWIVQHDLGCQLRR